MITSVQNTPEGFKSRFDRVLISGNGATVSKKAETLEASELGLKYWPKEIEIRTEKTGRRLVYTLQSIFRDRENEILYGEYKNLEYGFTMTVLND